MSVYARVNPFVFDHNPTRTHANTKNTSQEIQIKELKHVWSGSLMTFSNTSEYLWSRKSSTLLQNSVVIPDMLATGRVVLIMHKPLPLVGSPVSTEPCHQLSPYIPIALIFVFRRQLDRCHYRTQFRDVATRSWRPEDLYPLHLSNASSFF